MTSTPGAQAQVSNDAGRNRPSDIDELRATLRISPAASGIWRVGSMSRLTTWLPMPSKKQARSSGATRSPQSASV